MDTLSTIAIVEAEQSDKKKKDRVSTESTSAAKDRLILERDTKAAAIASPRSFLIKTRAGEARASFQRGTKWARTTIDERPVPSVDPRIYSGRG